mmetsp:Transcript_59523/g.171883  ORF Transcript_59523/g.171883 Transcript_59523/m.171883 type:complete len:203 (-) Transcript_59523:1392-2000(-)
MQPHPQLRERAVVSPQPRGGQALRGEVVEPRLARRHGELRGPHIRHLQRPHRGQLEVLVLFLIAVFTGGVVRHSLLTLEVLHIPIAEEVVISRIAWRPLLGDLASPAASLALELVAGLAGRRRRPQLCSDGGAARARGHGGGDGGLVGLAAGSLQLRSGHEASEHLRHRLADRSLLALGIGIWSVFAQHAPPPVHDLWRIPR